MHTNRYQPTASRPASAGASLLVLVAVGFGATMVGPTLAPQLFPEPPIVIRNIPIEPDPTPPPPQKKSETVVKQRTAPVPHQPDPVVRTASAGSPIDSTTDYTPITSVPPADPGPPSGGIAADPPKPPVVIGATVDPRYSDALQPPYPNSEIRAQTQGKLTARVLVGVDGRVKAIEILRTPSTGLSEATRRHALARWRFKPATRDGVPYEDWMTMTLNFRLVD